MGKFKVGDAVVYRTSRIYDEPVIRKVIKVTPTDVYLESSLYSRGVRYETETAEKYLRVLTKLEQALIGHEDTDDNAS